MYVTANRLNGRASPSKKATIEAVFDQGDILKATGTWSNDHTWIEVEGGEYGTCWVSISYISETIESFKAKNERYSTVKVRSHPVNGKLKRYIQKGKSVEITQVVLGWGKYSGGWVDLSLLDY